MLQKAQEIATLLKERVDDFAKAREEMRDTRDFIGWDEKRQDMRRSIAEMDKLIDALVIKYNAMAKMCGVTNRKDIVRSIVGPLDKTEREQAV